MTRDSGASKLKGWAAEFILIVTGILAALGVEDLRQSSRDRDQVLYNLEAVALDLQRDTQDLGLAIRAGQFKLYKGQELLDLLGLSVAVVPPHPYNAVPADVDLGPHPGPIPLPEVVFRLATPRRFDIADGTYEEMKVSGGIQLVEDLDLRRELNYYYWWATNLGRTDDRAAVIEAHVEYSRTLRSLGIVSSLGLDDDDVLRRLRSEPDILIDIVNLREQAGLQLQYHQDILGLALGLMDRLDSTLSGMR